MMLIRFIAIVGGAYFAIYGLGFVAYLLLHLVRSIIRRAALGLRSRSEIPDEDFIRSV